MQKKWLRELPLYLMILPGVIIVLIFSYGPMMGILMAFQRYVPTKGLFGSEWVGLKNFEYVFKMPDIFPVLYNTVFIALMKMAGGLFVPISTALLLNEVRNKYCKRTIQTLIYLPYFLSWVILGGILIDILSPSHGLVNQFLKFLGMKPVFFLGNYRVFPYTMVVTDILKNFGFGTIIYMAALTGIDPTLYEASVVDGADRWKQTLHITLPGILPTIIMMMTLSLGNVLNAGFDQIFNLYSPMVYRTGDILDTLVYRIGIMNNQYGVATAVGLFKSLVSFIMIVLSYKLADKYANYSIF